MGSLPVHETPQWLQFLSVEPYWLEILLLAVYPDAKVKRNLHLSFSSTRRGAISYLKLSYP